MSYTLQEISQAAEKSHLSKSMLENLIQNLPLKRSSQQNKALHVLFENIAYELNNKGFQFRYFGLKGAVIEVPYTANIVKESIWKHIMETMFDKKSTTEATTSDINAIFEALGMWLAKNDIYIEFPSAENI